MYMHACACGVLSNQAKGIKTNVRMLAEVEAADVGKSTHDAEMVSILKRGKERGRGRDGEMGCGRGGGRKTKPNSYLTTHDAS